MSLRSSRRRCRRCVARSSPLSVPRRAPRVSSAAAAARANGHRDWRRLLFGRPIGGARRLDLRRGAPERDPARAAPRNARAGAGAVRAVPRPGAQRRRLLSELRLASGEGIRLASGTAAPPAFDVWIRHRDDDGVDPAVALLALADGLPPAAMAHFPSRAPISTMTWAIDIVQPLTQHAWLLARSVSEACADGYSQQAMALFDPEGARVAAGRQTIAIFV